jgi:hypothetical protein
MNFNLTQAERDMLTQALRALRNQYTDVANGMDRTFGPEDGRAKEAWKDAHAKHANVDVLAQKLGVPR